MSFLIFSEQSSAPNTPSSGKGTIWYGTNRRPMLTNSAGTTQSLYNMSSQSIATAAGTTTLTNLSPIANIFTGSTTQTVKLPDATTIFAGQEYNIFNDSTGLVTVQDGNAGALVVIPAGYSAYFNLLTAGTVAGSWEIDTIGFIVDNTDKTKQIIFANSAATTGTGLTLAGQQATSQTLSFPIIRQAETLAVKPQIAGALVASPTGIANTSGLMLGLSNLSATNIITPQVTGRIAITICGVVAGGTATMTQVMVTIFEF